MLAVETRKSIRQIAKELGRSDTTVQRWLDRGMPSEEPERSKWVELNTRKQDEKGDESLTAQKIRQEIEVLKVKKRRQKLAYEKEKGRLVERAEVDRQFALFINDARVRLEAIPAKVGAYADEAERPVVIEEVRKEIEQVLRGLASANLDDEQ